MWNLSQPSFETSSTLALGGIAAFLLFLALERASPLRIRKRPILGRLIVNLLLSGISLIIGAILVTRVSLFLAAWVSGNQFGLIHVISLPPTAQLVVSLLLMDLSFYYWHLANHKVPFLWRFHNVHHIDPDLDVSTALRFHFGEVFLSSGFRVLQVGLIGVAPVTYFLYETFFQAATLFHHSNLRLPIRGERILNRAFVTPRMHGIHHSLVEKEANSNYAVVFSMWDRLHRTIRLNVPQSEVVVGIPAYMTPINNTFWKVVTQPFRKQLDPWLFPDGKHSIRDSERTVGGRSLLAE